VCTSLASSLPRFVDSRILTGGRAIRSRMIALEQELMTTRQLSSLSATGMSTGSAYARSGGSLDLGQQAATQKVLEEKVLRLQEDLTSAYRLQSENAHTSLRMKEQAEKDERALLKKEEE
jgi:hypothetical protein